VGIKDDGAKVIGVTSNDPSMTEEMWLASESEVRWAWNTQQAQSIKSLVTVKLMAIQAGKISEMVAIDPTFLEPELYDEDQEFITLA
jgi:hypothetical protein